MRDISFYFLYKLGNLKMDSDCEETRLLAIKQALAKSLEKRQFLHDQINIHESRLNRLHEDLRDVIAQEAVYKTLLKLQDLQTPL
jgi:hypothetical protein